uniref:RUN and FYVE domain-containing protein 4 isoform X1 n=1 Tax=Panthera onca TaxID=9690 RepID=UPI00295378CA|nr:RUN and FYVE domain-containing protein 4 isoform X1 [Panthera onca]XP_060479514.1 RUN and FYVE domain-containing protein 4 isoform X1 [Panthera onca]XP_060479516.1 RUN and FYVE domain-containing protein 4 isoform X1 [Panthera onca]XP_060479517.1 RUN and FYVE domain-containing protein 4 isoform X1 [Panthera onca]
MAEEGAILTRNLKAAVSAILQGYPGGQPPVTDASAELHRLCGCLELLLQFDQKEQKSLLRPRKDYWDFLCSGLRQQRGSTEPARFVCSQDKLKTSLAKGRAFIRFCLAHGQLAESLQLCLLNPELTREWYGPRSPLVCPELREDLLDSLYALNGVTFDLNLRWPDLDEAWPMFSESCCPSRTQGRRPRKTKDSPKQLPSTRCGYREDSACAQKGEHTATPPVKCGDAAMHGGTGEPGDGFSGEISATRGNPTAVQPEELHTSQTSCLQDAPREDWLARLPRSQQQRHLPPFLEKKREDPRSLGSSQGMWEPAGEELQQAQEKGAPRTGICLEISTPSIQGQGEGSEGAPKEVTGTEAKGRRILPSAEGTHEGRAERGHVRGLLASSPTGTIEDTMSGNQQEWEVPSIPGEPRVLWGLGTKEDFTPEKPQEETGETSVTRRKEQAEVALQDVVKSLRRGLRKTEERAQHQEQLLKEKEGELRTLQERLSRCQEERARLQTELEQNQQEAERRDAMYEKELGGQRDLVHAMKMRVLELIQEKDDLWQKVQHLSSMAPGCCVDCSKVFGRLSRRYPCRLCGGLVCHACSVDYKKRGRHCPPCSQKGAAQFDQ